jgi:hypothetical protein
VHVRDLIEVGLVDQTWVNRLPDALQHRLADLLAHPEA